MDLEMLVKSASTVILTSYLLASISTIILRESKVQNYRPSFKTPFYPWLQIITILIFIALILDMGLQAIEISVGLILICLIIYLVYGRKSNQEYALLHLIERVMDKKLTNRGLEEELKEIIHDRDEIVKDEFDHLIEKAVVFDFDKKLQLDDFFELVSSGIAKSHKQFKTEVILQMLREREAESSTALTPLVAIPHMIAEGEKIFDIFIARSSAGIHFSATHPTVKAVFIIIGSRDKRNLHLRSLAAIAQLIQNPDFEEKWLNAANPESLRDLLLLGERKRHNG